MGNYKKLRNFYQLNINEFKIIDFLIQQPNRTAIANYSDFTEMMGLNKCTMVSNIRHALKRLEKCGIVTIIYDNSCKTMKPMKWCFLNTDWETALENKEG